MSHNGKSDQHPSELRQLGLRAARRGDFATARSLLESALLLEPADASTWVNLGAVFQALRQPDDALACYDRAIGLAPHLPQPWNNRSLLLSDAGRYAEAASSAQSALRLNPSYPEAQNNLGIALHALGLKAQAREHYEQAIKSNPHYAKALANLGAVQFELGNFEEALIAMERALAIDPNSEFLPGLAQHARMRICNWQDFESRVDELKALTKNGLSTCPPFAALSLMDDPEIHRNLASQWFTKKIALATRQSQTIPATQIKFRKLRIGYFSADFHHHATAHLMAGLFEAHNKSSFDILAFSFGNQTNDPMSRRIRGGFSQFIDVGQLSDEEIAKHARSLDLDIAVDLKGYTQDSRMRVFAYRAAPIQVGYIGYPGTVGSKILDYIITDHVVSPASAESDFTEKLIRMPVCYQCNDPARERPAKSTLRTDHGLPSAGLVFACFNNSYKITPVVFAIWMRLLKSARDSTLWLLSDHQLANDNLRREAAKNGIDPSRVVFAPRVPTLEHLERHHHVDIFLDTFPYNAHTTASDALWMGLPLVTHCGRSFASRVAASLLSALDLPELIAKTWHDYEAIAMRLACDERWRLTVRDRLRHGALTSPLFKADEFAAAIETAYRMIIERHSAGLPPAHIDLSHPTTAGQ